MTTVESKDIICFAGCDWWYHNRGLFCPQIMTRLARRGYRVLFVNSLGMRIPSLLRDRNAVKKIKRKLRSMFRFLRKVDGDFYVLTPISIPCRSGMLKKLNQLSVTAQIKLVRRLLGFRHSIGYIGCPPAVDILKSLNCLLVIYERTDLFEEMPGADKTLVASIDRDLMATASLVLYVNRALWETGIQTNRNSVLLGHGVDYEIFANASEADGVPADMSQIPSPIVGYYGDISDKTLDLALIEHAAQALPAMSVVLVGPVSADVSRLRVLPNVYFPGQKAYGEIASYGRMFDVAIMPWNQNKWIEHCNPVKAKEYLALGNPIVTTYYPEVEPYRDLVYVARTYEEFVAGIQAALREDDRGLREKRRAAVKKETWDSKVESIVRFIEAEADRS